VLPEEADPTRDKHFMFRHRKSEELLRRVGKKGRTLTSTRLQSKQ
jgi:hypothetical protein